MTPPRWFPTRLVVYALVGASGTLAHYLLFLGFLSIRVPVLGASLCGYLLGAVVNYAMNHRLTFASERPHREAAPRFFGVALIGLALNLLVVGVLHGPLGLPPLIAQLAATAFCLLATYALNAKWSFAATRRAET